MTKSEMAILKECSYHSDDSIHSLVCQILVDFADDEGEQMLVRLTSDHDYLVRTQACDSLSSSANVETYELLKGKAQKDPFYLVRGYAISSLGSIAPKIGKNKELIDFLKQCLPTEKGIFVRANIFCELCRLGEAQYLSNLLDFLNARRINTRYAVMNMLKEIRTPENSEAIIDALVERKKKESIPGIIKSIEEFINREL